METTRQSPLPRHSFRASNFNKHFGYHVFDIYRIHLIAYVITELQSTLLMRWIIRQRPGVGDANAKKHCGTCHQRYRYQVIKMIISTGIRLGSRVETYTGMPWKNENDFIYRYKPLVPRQLFITTTFAHVPLTPRFTSPCHQASNFNKHSSSTAF